VEFCEQFVQLDLKHEIIFVQKRSPYN